MHSSHDLHRLASEAPPDTAAEAAERERQREIAGLQVKMAEDLKAMRANLRGNALWQAMYGDVREHYRKRREEVVSRSQPKNAESPHRIRSIKPSK